MRERRRMQERYAQVQALKNSGASLNAINRQLGLAFRTVRKYALPATQAPPRHVRTFATGFKGTTSMPPSVP
ncbi:hypothetical protein ACTWPT_16870 [Nonomuraea sp. 3N208]|uniref:hypothetical protein n=1 Tax=Nonomuraea sp. 3N208 TaxID=3457421 RepID=UPI003FCD04FE